MKRETGLPGLEPVGQIADTLFPICQQLEEFQPCFIGEGME